MRKNILKMSLIISSPLLKLQRKIGDNPSLTTYVMGYFQKIQEEELTYVVVHLVYFTTRTHFIGDHLRVCYYDVWEGKKRFKLCKKHTQEYVDHINLDQNFTFT